MSKVKQIRGSVAAYAARQKLDITKKTLPRSKKLISRSSKARNEVARRIKFQRFKNKVLTGSSRIKTAGKPKPQQKEVRSQHAKMQAATRARAGATRPRQRTINVTGSSHPRVAQKMATVKQMLQQRMKKPVRPVARLSRPIVLGDIKKHIPQKLNTPGSKAPSGKRFVGKSDRLKKAVERAKNIQQIRKNKSRGLRSSRLSKVAAKVRSAVGSLVRGKKK
jgi:hypothetical protein